MKIFDSVDVEFRKSLCKECDCGADFSDPCAACPRRAWFRHRACIGPPLPPSHVTVAYAAKAIATEVVAFCKGKAWRNGNSGYATEEEITMRLETCKTCEHFRPSDHRCALCTCHLNFKAKLASQSCPIKKW